MRFRTVPLFLTLALAAGAAPMHIVLKDGRVLHGNVLETSGTAQASGPLTLESGGMRILLQRGQIATMEEATPEDVQIAQARAALQAKEPERALALLDEARKMSFEPQGQADALADLLLYFGDDLAHAIPKLDDAHTTQLRNLLRDATHAKKLDPARNAEFVSRRLQFDMLLGDDTDTSRVLTYLSPDYFKRNTTERNRLSEWVLGVLPAMQAPREREDSATTSARQRRALGALDWLRRIDPDAAAAQRTQMVLEWAKRARDGGRWDDALTLYATQVLPGNPEIARDRMQVTLEEAERAARTADDLPAAAELYTRYGVPHLPKFARERLLAIWRDQGYRDLRRGEFDTARECFARADALQPGGQKKDYAQLDYQQQRANTPTSDTLARYQLAMFCLQHDMFREAISELKIARTNPLIQANADAHIDSVRNKLAEAELKDLYAQYEANEFGKVIGGVNLFMQEDYPQGYLKQAQQLLDLTNDAVKMRTAARPQQAEGLFQRAQRAYYAGRYAEADALLRTIMEHYQDTMTLPQARTFYATVRQKLQLAQIESGSGTKSATPQLADVQTSDTASSPTLAADELERLGTGLAHNLERMNYQR